MKLLKVLTIVLFSLFLTFSVVYAQENNTAVSGSDNQLKSDNTGDVSGSDTGKTVSIEKSEKDTVKPDQGSSKNVPVNEKKSESRKTVNKREPEKKEVKVPPVVKEENMSLAKMDGDLLLINEGNFKYKRIPGIKLADIKPESADTGMQVAEAPKTEQNKSGGFLGLSKTASDIIVKGGVLILVLLIFVLYKSRMTHPGRKSSRKRSVLNSYRK